MTLTSKTKKFLLAPKALPTTTHHLNLRQLLLTSQWQKMRQFKLMEAQNKCQLCLKKVKRLELHELWVFDFAKNQQVLDDLVILCKLCHTLQHVMLFKLHVDQGKRQLMPVINHYNQLTDSQLNAEQFFKLASQNYQALEKEWAVTINPRLIKSKERKNGSAS